MEINSLLESANGYKSLQADSDRLAEKWSQSGLLEGLDEKGNIKKIQIYPKKSKAMNLGFDVTPAKYVTGLITEKGICDASTEGLKKLFK